MLHYPQLEAFIIARNKALEALDVPAMRKLMGTEVGHLSDEGIIVGMHKVRLHVTTLPRYLREQSLTFLRIHGFSDVDGIPLPDKIED